MTVYNGGSLRMGTGHMADCTLDTVFTFRETIPSTVPALFPQRKGLRAEAMIR